MTVLTYQSLFYIPTPDSVLQTPVQGVEKNVRPNPIRQPKFRSAAMAATGLFLVITPPTELLNRPDGWEAQSVQPPHPRPEHAGSIARGDDGTEAKFVPPIITIVWGFHESHVFQRKSRAASGALLRGDDGIQARFGYWINLGWPVRPVQPPRRIAPMRSAIQAIGDVGIEKTLIYWKPDGWKQVATQPPHPNPERDAAILRGDDGTQEPFVYWRNAGWPVQPFQPPHRRPEVKAASFLRGDDGTQNKYSFWRNAGWEVQSVQPPAFERGKMGAFMRGHDGIEATFTYILSFPDPHPRRPLYRLGGGGTYWKGRNA